MLPPGNSYEAVAGRFEWRIPARYNIAQDVCDKWADGSNRLALIVEAADTSQKRYTFDDLKRLSNCFANAMKAQGVVRGDRVAIFVRQSVEAAIAHLAAYRMGCIAVPLFALFGTDAIEFRLAHSGAKAVVTDAQGAAKIAQIRDALPELHRIFDTDADFWPAIEAASDDETLVDTAADDPAVIIYTSGTTGKPKGALHGHRILPGHLPGVEMSQQCFPRDATLFWTPADWAWIGGLFDVLMPSWHHGVPVLARRFDKFDGADAFDLLTRNAVSHTFLPPTALKMMRATPHAKREGLALRSVASGGESLGAELLSWGRAMLGVTINEFYGQTECNMVLSSCEQWFEPRNGCIGKAVPGHRVAIVDDAGVPVPNGTQGHIAIQRPDPVMFLGYWRDEAATAQKFRGDFLLTGDLGTLDDDGFFRFIGRDDDVITSAGYRIGPGPIEDCLIRHPAVRFAAVIGVPDAKRTEIVCAVVVLNDGFEPGDALVRELQEHVRIRLAAHEYPREVRFVAELPMTATGKVIRKSLRTQFGADNG
ncbi:AMP-dependent synthetase and ligase [Caballeronia arvi]|uniref:AMP-dependent synthetase and ligase n=1 Tax=Caballeronia arvi TaxID=1777135 RepID=A0A158HL73_9BURK|nr:acyl-CoA synthetase [Caballeronia arvi]SAL45125.1 AMP-dependent synthetase and ligase [Caballeronia arvi]